MFESCTQFRATRDESRLNMYLASANMGSFDFSLGKIIFLKINHCEYENFHFCPFTSFSISEMLTWHTTILFGPIWVCHVIIFIFFKFEYLTWIN